MLKKIKKIIPKKIKISTKRFFMNLLDSALYFFKKNKTKLTPDSFNTITFVCKGNVCRSAFAEHYLKSQLTTSSLIVGSCGLDVDQGVHSPVEAVQIAYEFGVYLDSNVSKNINDMNIGITDHIIAMEFDQYQRIIQKYPQYKNNVRLLKDYMPWPQRLQCNIADPYGGDVKEFRHCFAIIKRALDLMGLQLSEKSAQP